MNEVNVKEFSNPTMNYIVIKNPLFEKREELKASQQLPPTERDKYLMENVMGVFEKLEILAVGPDVKTQTSEGTLKPGDFATSTMQSVEAGVGVLNGKYIFIRESSLVGVW